MMKKKILILSAFFLLLVYTTINAATLQSFIEKSGIKGGLLIHLGATKEDIEELLKVKGFTIQILHTDQEKIKSLQEHIHSKGVYGPISINRYNGKNLPYINNIVNILIAENKGALSTEEIKRVLCPKGIAFYKKDNKWVKYTKKRPKDIDEWTHYLHDAGNNAVTKDKKIGPPRYTQWVSGPKWSRSHHTLASISSVVSAQGRIFYVVDEAPSAGLQVPPKWSLTARDAFNGFLLWKRPLDSWAYTLRKFRSGPAQLPRTLVVADDKLFFPLGMNEPVSMLDAKTGKILAVFKETKSAEELIFINGILLVVTGSPVAEHALADPIWRGKHRVLDRKKEIIAIHIHEKKQIWKWASETESPAGLTMASDGERVYFHTQKSAVSLDLKSGKQVWNTSLKLKVPVKTGELSKKGKRKLTQDEEDDVKYGPTIPDSTLVVKEGTVLLANSGNLYALSSDKGELLWQGKTGKGFRSPADLFVINSLVWVGGKLSQGLDIKTGEVKKEIIAMKDLWTAGHHHRCYREKASERYIMTSHRGIEFFDLEKNEHSRNNWIRGVCQYGILLGNGYVYTPSHACGCYPESILRGFRAMSAERNFIPDPPSEKNRLTKGKAYNEIAGFKKNATSTAQDWPMYRKDILKSGSTGSQQNISSSIKVKWETPIRGKCTQPMISGGKVVTANKSTHTVYALDEKTGTEEWHFTVCGKIDSPPTIHKKLVLFGSADGHVYCLRLSDGALAWKFQAAPYNRYIPVEEHLESLWPVHGSVLVNNDIVYFTAGRSSWTDDGMNIFGLDMFSGTTKYYKKIQDKHPVVDKTKPEDEKITKIKQNKYDYRTFAHPDKSDAFSMDGAKSDILVSDGTHVFLRNLMFDRQLNQKEKVLPHLFSTTRFMDGEENHRSHWMIGKFDFQGLPVAYPWVANGGIKGYGGYAFTVPMGLLLSFSKDMVWGIDRVNPREHKTAKTLYTLYAREYNKAANNTSENKDFSNDKSAQVTRIWEKELLLRPRAMIQNHNQLLLGGMKYKVAEEELNDYYDGKKDGELWILNAKDGNIEKKIKLKSPPVWDGMAVANGRIFMATVDGRIVCLGK